jgi:hypothetical protein
MTYSFELAREEGGIESNVVANQSNAPLKDIKQCPGSINESWGMENIAGCKPMQTNRPHISFWVNE